MEERHNATLARQALTPSTSAISRNSPPMTADDVNWYEVGASESLRGKEAVFGSLGAGGRDFDIEADVHDAVANDDHTLAVINATGRRGGRTLR